MFNDGGLITILIYGDAGGGAIPPVGPQDIETESGIDISTESSVDIETET